MFAAPTRDQGKKIFWNDLKALVPPWAMVGKPRESELTIKLINGAEISVVGMDKPERIEGRPLDWICCDEYGNMKATAWAENIRPALSTIGRPGRAWLTGVPEGRNHYYKLALKAQEPDAASKGWGYFHWKSSEICDPDEIAAARAEMDPLVYDQEYNASFLNFEGRAYYPFDRSIHAARRLEYDPKLPLIFCFDFNTSPGVAAVLQEQVDPIIGPFTAVIGEVWIPSNSNTPAVCRKLVADWSHHTGEVHLYGDASGGAKVTSATEGSDWELVRRELRPAFPERIRYKVKNKNPPERVRVNAVNARLMTADGKIHLLVDPIKAPHVILDFEGVTLLEGGSGEIDKHADDDRTHMLDGVGYYVEVKFPLQDRGVTIEEIF